VLRFCTYQEIKERLGLNESLWLQNLRCFLQVNIQAKYIKLLDALAKSSEKLYVCKEDKESFTKSKIVLIT